MPAHLCRSRRRASIPFADLPYVWSWSRLGRGCQTVSSTRSLVATRTDRRRVPPSVHPSSARSAQAIAGRNRGSGVTGWSSRSLPHLTHAHQPVLVQVRHAADPCSYSCMKRSSSSAEYDSLDADDAANLAPFSAKRGAWWPGLRCLALVTTSTTQMVMCDFGDFERASF
jgi:hypothetical protein